MLQCKGLTWMILTGIKLSKYFKAKTVGYKILMGNIEAFKACILISEI